MRRSVLLCLRSGLLLSALIGCSRESAPIQEAAAVTDTPPVGSPRIHVPEARRSLGKVPLGPQTIEMVIRNEGDGDLQLVGLESSCSCAKVVLRAETVLPGESTILEVRISPRQPEESSAKVVLHSNDPDQPRIELFLEWTAIGSFTLQPQMVDFGIVRPGETATQEVCIVHDLSGAGGDLCDVTNIVCQPRQILIARKLEEETTDTEMIERYALELQTDGETDGTAQQGGVRFEFNGCVQAESFVPVTWLVREMFQASPSRLFLGAGLPGREVHATAELSCDDGQELEIVSTHWRRGVFDLSVSYTTTSPSTAQILITGSGPKQEGFLEDELVIRCARPQEREFLLPVSGLVTSPPIATGVR